MAHLLLWVVDVLPVPEVLGELLGDQVTLGREREEAVPTLAVPAVPRRHIQLLQTLACPSGERREGVACGQ